MSDRDDLMLEIRKDVRVNVGLLKGGQLPQMPRLSSIGDRMCGTMTSLHGIQGDVADLEMRVDQIEKRLGLSDTEH